MFKHKINISVQHKSNKYKVQNGLQLGACQALGPEIGRDRQGVQLLRCNIDKNYPSPGEGPKSVVVVGLPPIIRG